MTQDHINRGKRVRDLPAYKHSFDAYVRLGGQIVNLTDLTNNDFKKAIVDILCLRELLVGVKTPHRLAVEKANEETAKIMKE